MNRRKLLSVALFSSAGAVAQTQTSRREVHVVQESSGSPNMMWFGEAEGIATKMQFIAAGNLDGKVVKSAPYSAEAVTESTRTLSDGTRIVNKHTTLMARDKDGRTRRENSFSNSGPFQSAGVSAPRLVTINDPVAKEVYILNYDDKTARKVKMGEPAVFRSERTDGDRKEVFEERVHVSVSRKGGEPGGPPDVVTFAPHGAGPIQGIGAAGIRVPFDSRNAKSEKLEAQVMEGVPVEGTRTTHTIPAGTIGNDRAIVSTSESWYSNDLQMVIFSRNDDPQVGETTYRVSNLRRTEPDPSQFKIPADFKLVEETPGPMMLRRKIESK